ncbi:GTP pyrophosphokinase [Ilyobacter polytropus]|uniref:RelA/SpoT domain protein n=1 Tax=Ilyobacter polytropus (strain ATCC 51220 / DSM 2926 / LMG 16218 / CuHBu1) TaxID=572544 RepID=E3HD43_ILYPC|nr:GTP pyrophosphokinase [Ilyobacter polytropus]ADO84519.1 RelA/SpoT domain protein [Ilyobacter polytropus DSM 2926]
MSSSEILNRESFFKEFSIDEEYFKSTGLEWSELEKIYQDYTLLVPLMEKRAEEIVLYIMALKDVHSVRRRVKKPEHLIEKIIRKGKKYTDRGINVKTYKKIVTDLIGVRVLHLFKDDWKSIHEEIIDLWETKETPQINIRRGDYNLDKLREGIKNYNCDIIVREHGYRSVHYLIGASLSPQKEVFVEIQVRTVFEEAWSEIDHIIRYPYDIDNPILSEYLGIFNRIVGSADEMGMFLKKLKKEVGKNNPNPRELDNKFK